MIGQRLGSFVLESKLGSGAMGEVYRATYTKNNRQAAVKIISADYLQHDNALKRFTREAEILEQLRHPNIVRYYARGRFKGTFYYAMEFVEGQTLDNVLEDRGFLSWREVVDFGIQLCHALHYAHEHGVVHRDLKPSNLMITADGQIKLTDFGIAKDLDATVALTKTGRTLGTAAYMAPEQIKGTPAVSHKTDLYALGCLFYQMLAGVPPFVGQSAVVLMHLHISETPPRPSEKNPDVPKALDNLIVKLMSKNPPDRPWDAAAVAYELEQLRDKAERGERVPMVFETAAPRGQDPTIDPAAPTRPGKPTKTATRRTRAETAEPAPLFSRRTFETLGLVLALLAMIGFIGYQFWPPSQEYLYQQAESLMQSEERGDWRRAFQKYLEPLDRRFPEHPYQDQVQAWRDRLQLVEAQDRSIALEGNLPRFSQPQNPAEQLYKATYRSVVPLANLDQYAQIKDRWEKYVQQLEQRNNPEERGWLLLGYERIAQADEERNRQRTAIIEAYRTAQKLARERPEAGISLLNTLLDEYANAAVGDPDLSALLREVEAANSILNQLLAEDDPEPEPEPKLEPLGERPDPSDEPESSPDSPGSE